MVVANSNINPRVLSAFWVAIFRVWAQEYSGSVVLVGSDISIGWFNIESTVGIAISSRFGSILVRIRLSGKKVIEAESCSQIRLWSH